MEELSKICHSALNLRIITFFHENPTTVDSSSAIARWLNHEQKEIEKALDFLVHQNILVTHRTGSTVAYAYTQDKEIIKQIEKVLQRG